MDLYNKAIEIVEDFGTFNEWPELGILFREYGATKPHGWDIGLPACLAVGGKEEDVIPLIAAYGCLQVGILTVDDLLDQDPRGAYHFHGKASAANMAVAYQAAGLNVIFNSNLNPTRKNVVAEKLNWMVLETALGQYLDLQQLNGIQDYWRVVRGKSSPYHAAALYAGAVFGGASLDLCNQIEEFGSLFGEIVQIHDDLKDSLSPILEPDWILQRQPLPILFTETVDHPDRKEFLRLRDQIEEPGYLKKAQVILLRSGAISFSIDELIKRYRKGKALLSDMELSASIYLERLLEETMHPAMKLLEEVSSKNEIESYLSEIN